MVSSPLFCPICGAANTLQATRCFACAHMATYRSHHDRVLAVAWAPDGRRIASASNDKTVKLCDPQTGQSLLTYRGHSDAVKAVSWSPDGKHIAFGDVHNLVQVWRVL